MINDDLPFWFGKYSGFTFSSLTTLQIEHFQSNFKLFICHSNYIILFMFDSLFFSIKNDFLHLNRSKNKRSINKGSSHRLPRAKNIQIRLFIKIELHVCLNGVDIYGMNFPVMATNFEWNIWPLSMLNIRTHVHLHTAHGAQSPNRITESGLCRHTFDWSQSIEFSNFIRCIWINASNQPA